MKKVITTMLVAAMVLSMAVPTSAATITRKKSTGTTASTTKVSGDYSLKMVDKTLQFIRGGKVVSSIETKDGKITLRKSSAGGISVVFTDANGKRRNITLGKQDSVSLSGTFTQVSVDKALGSSFDVEMEKGSKVTNFYAKGAAKVTLNGSVTTLNVTSSNGNVTANGTVSRAYAVSKKSISGMSAGKITQTSTGTSSNGSVNTATKSSNSSNTTVNSGSGSSGSSSSGGSSGIIINGGGSNNGGNSTSKRNPTVSYTASVLPTYDEGTVLTSAMLNQFGLKATYGNSTVAGTFSWTTANTKVMKGTYSYSVTFTPKDTKTYNSVRTSVKIVGKEVEKAQTLAEAKAAIEAALKGVSVTNAVTEAQIQKLADDCITSTDIKAVAKVTVTPATTTAEGTVKGTITLTKGTETATITVDLKIAQLSALQAAKAEVEAALEGIKATKDTTKADVEAVVNPIDTKYTSVDITVGDVTVVEADKTVSVVVSLKEGEATDTVSKTWTYTDGGEEGEAKAPTFINNLDKTTEEIQLDTAKPVTFTVKASVDGTTEAGVTYQWYKSTVKETSDVDARTPLGTGNSYTLTTSDLSNNYYYYFVIATNTVNGVSESTPSDVKMIKVVLPEGSAEAPVVSVATTKDSYTLGNAADNITATVTGVTPSATSTVSYQWYKADSVNAVGTEIGTDSATYKPSTGKAGVAYYYVKVTNTDTAATGLKSVSTTSERIKITVTAAGTVSAAPVDVEGETTAIDVTFNPALPEDTMNALTIADFEIKGETAAKHDEKCTLALSKHTIPTTPANTIRLYVTGLDKAETATLTLKKDISDTGITISDADKAMSVAIAHNVAPAAAAKVTNITAVANTSAVDKVLDTKEIKLTFDKELTAYTDVTNTELTAADGTTKVAVTPTSLDATKKVVTATITVPTTGTTATEVLTLTKLNNVAVAEADQKTVTVNRDITAPTVVSAILGSDNRTIKVQFDEPLKGTDTTGFTVAGKVTSSLTATSAFNGSDTSMVVITLGTPLADTTELPLSVSYNATTGDLTDDSVKLNALAAFTKPVASNVPVDKLAIANVAVDTAVSSAPVVTVEMNDRVSIEGGTISGTDLFDVKGNVSKHSYKVKAIGTDTVTPRSSSARTATQANAFKITLDEALKPEDTAVNVKINTASADAKKVTSVSKPDAGMDKADTTVKPSDEVEVLSASVADVEVAGTKGTKLQAPVDVDITLANGTFKALGQGDDVSGWFKNLPTALTAVVKTAVTAGGDKVTITIDGTPSAVKEEAMQIVIPTAAITDATEDLTVATNAKAKFAIVDDTPAGTTATAELANITFAGDKATLPAGTANTQAGVEAELIKLAQAQVDAGYTVSVDTVYASSYNTSTKVWSGKFVVTNKADGIDKATDATARNITVTISTTPPSGTASATVDNKTVSGTVNAQITPVDVTIELTNDKFNALAANDSVKTWFNLPNGLDAKVKAAVVQDTTTAVITISGTPTAISGDKMVINIPTSALASSVALKVTDNADAKYDIKAATPTPATKIDVTAAAGSAAGETSVSATATASGTLKYKTSNASITGVNTGDAEPKGLTSFVGSQNIAITAPNTYVHVYEIDSENKVVGYGEYKVAGDEIKCSVSTITTQDASLTISGASAGDKAAEITNSESNVTFTLTDTKGYFALDADGKTINITQAATEASLSPGSQTVTIRATDDANGAYIEDTSVTITLS